MRRPVTISILSLCFFVLTGGLFHAQPITYQFDPPAVEYTTTQTNQTSRTMDGKTGMSVGFTVVAKNKLEPVELGYRLSVNPVSVTSLNRGVPTANPVLDLIRGIPYEVVLNRFGEATEVVGFTDLEARIDSALDGAMADRARQRIQAAQLRKEISDEWNGLIGFRRQCEAEVGQIMYDRKRNRIQSGDNPVIFTASRIVDTMTIGGESCARLVVTACSNPATLADSLGLTRQKIMDVFALTEQIIGQHENAALDMVSIKAGVRRMYRRPGKIPMTPAVNIRPSKRGQR